MVGNYPESCSRFLEHQLFLMSYIITPQRWNDLRKLARENSSSFTPVVEVITRDWEKINDSNWEEYVKEVLNSIKNVKKDLRYNSVQGLSTLGFLGCHVTNAFAGAFVNLTGKVRSVEPYTSIIDSIQAQGTNKFQISISTLKPGSSFSIVATKSAGINGSIGVILDSGYIYEAYYSDARTHLGTSGGGSNYRTGDKEKRVLAGMAVNFGTGKYNELIVRNWTIGGLFYTKGVQEEVIAKLQAISQQYSYKEYPNPAWINRKSNNLTEIQADLVRNYLYAKGKLIDGGKKIIKIYPVYEIDLETNQWKIVFNP